MDPFDITQKISDRDTTRYVRIVEGLDDDAVAELKSLKIPGLGFEPCSARVYPMGNIAAHVLGGMRADGKGLEGVELKFDPLLSGHDGYKRSLKDARRRSIGAMADDYLAPEHGRHLVLTLDANIQMIVQQELNDVCTKYRAKTAEAVVMDPRTGEIVALANWPTFSPQNLEDSNAQVWTNRAIVVPYEPGSTIKPFIVGPALAWKAVQATDILPIHGPARHLGYGGRVVKDVATYPQLAVWDVIVKSSNIGMTYVAEKLGTFRLHAAVTQFGFGKFTGVELPGENHGRVNPLSKWTRFTQDSMAQGYELMVTPLQLARAMCAYANGGKLVEPKLVRGVLEPDGVTIQSVTPLDRAKMTQVIDKSTADTMRRILADVMVRGTGTKGRSSIYTIFGKTGTAHRAVGGSYNESNYTASFCGGAPYENPRLVVAIVVHDPDKSLAHYGGVISAPVAQRVLERSLAYLQVPPSPLLAPPAEQYAKVLYNFDPKLYDRKQPKNNPATANVHD
jgi:cell division protein FtsI (penicillin-binding protein 3)